MFRKRKSVLKSGLTVGGFYTSKDQNPIQTVTTQGTEIKTSGNFSYIFNLRKKKIIIKFKEVAQRGILGGKPPGKEAVKNYLKFLAAFLGGAYPASMTEDVLHASIGAASGGDVMIVITPWYMRAYVDLESPVKQAIVGIFPSFIEALLGFFLIKQGLKEGNPIYFGYGVLNFSVPALNAMVGLFAKTDYSQAAGLLREAMVQHFGENNELVEIISKAWNPVAIFLMAAMVYGSIILGVKYIPKISEEFITAKKTKNILKKLKEGHNDLYKALAKIFFAKKAYAYRKAVLEKIFNPEQ